MLPVLTKPLIQYGVEEAMRAGVNSMVMVTSKNKQSIEDYFKANPEIEDSVEGTVKKHLLDEVNYVSRHCDFTFTRQHKMMGLGHAIYTGKKFIGNESFSVILPDDLCTNDGDSVLAQLIKTYDQYPECCIVAIEEVSMTEVHNYGVIDGELLEGSSDVYKVKNMVEKPKELDAPSNLAIIGRYILIPEIFDVLENTLPDKNGEIQITDALLSLAKQGRVLAYKFKGMRFDCGNVKGLLNATSHFAKIEGLI
jgi:UTP--glucose-1-phosphate uridylyltransferase